jgi:PAS domain S-box-containing protein
MDKSNMKKNEEILFDLINNMPTMAYYCDLIGDCKFVNNAYIKFTGKTIEDIGNFRWKGLNLVYPEDVAVIIQAWHKSLENLTPYTAEYRLLHVSGQYRWVQSRAFYIKDKEGKPYAWFGSIEDIHEYKIKILALIKLLEQNMIKAEV